MLPPHRLSCARAPRAWPVRPSRRAATDDDYRVINYTNVLIQPDLYASPIADFLSLPPQQMQRSFTLSLKAKPKKRHNASGSTPMDGGTTGAWSDDVRRAFITTRLAEARASADPPKCCDEWTSEFGRTPVLKVAAPRSPPQARRKPHWFSQWASHAPPPLRAENISFSHVINPFKGGQDPEHRHAQETTLRSISHAAALANAVGVHVDVICVMFPEDVPHIDICQQPGFTIALMNNSAVDLLPQFKHPARLPFLQQILYAGWLHGKGGHLVYSNIDIGVQAPFYIKLARRLQLHPDTPLSLIREEFEHTPPSFSVEQALGWRGTGLAHPGHDCWAFPREWVPKLVLGFTLVGVSMVATDLMQALHAHAGCRMGLASAELTYHHVTGDSVVKHPQNQRARANQIFTGLYTAWNCVQFARNRQDVLEKHPDYAQCWFNHQAEWSSYAYQCGMTIEHLPHEFKLLWHNSSTAAMGVMPPKGETRVEGQGRSNCNLPAICHQCRGGREGQHKRPPADLMAAMPCGFCRCHGDLDEPTLITLPTATAPRPDMQVVEADAQEAASEAAQGAAAPDGAAPIEAAQEVEEPAAARGP